MTRLTSDLRTSILTQILKRGFLGRLMEQIKLETDFAKDVYDFLYAEELKIVDKVPSRWISEAAFISLMINNEHVSLSWTWGYNNGTFNKILSPYQSSITRKLPPGAASYYAAHVFDYDDPFAERWERIKDAREKLGTEYRTASAQANTILNNFGTVSKLVKTWPEIEPVVKELLGQPAVELPALPIADLNKVFDLPPETKAA